MSTILFVALSKSMADSANKIAKELNIQMKTIISSKPKAVMDVQGYPQCQIYISRGGTAGVLKEIPGKTIISLLPTINDIMGPINDLVKRQSNKIVVLSSVGIIGHKKNTYNFSDIEIIFSPYEGNEPSSYIKELISNGVTGIVGGRSAMKMAESFDINAASIENGEESVRVAIQQAMSISKAKIEERKMALEMTEQVYSHSAALYSAIESASSATEQLTASSQELASISKSNMSYAESASKEVMNTNQIIEVVNKIAAQTNLLGLNAAIEAARSGEYGKGFAVVAQEIRKLAVESSKQVDVISKMLHQLKLKIDSLSKNVELTSDISSEQALANESVARMLQDIQNVGEKLTGILSQNMGSTIE